MKMASVDWKKRNIYSVLLKYLNLGCLRALDHSFYQWLILKIWNVGTNMAHEYTGSRFEPAHTGTGTAHD